MLPEDVRIEFSIETEKHYYLDANESAVLTLGTPNFGYDKGDGTTTPDVQTVDLFWNYVFGAEEYEVQIAFDDFYSIDKPQGEARFENSISINTTNTWV